jgi:hypothetical protein
VVEGFRVRSLAFVVLGGLLVVVAATVAVLVGERA